MKTKPDYEFKSGPEAKMAAITVARSGLPVVGAVVDDIKISSDMADIHFSDGAWVPVHLTPANFGRQMTAAERIACRYLFARSDVREIQTLQRLVATIMTVARDAMKYIDNAPTDPVQLEWYDQVSHQLEEVILDARMISNTIPGLKAGVLHRIKERNKGQRSEDAWARHRIGAVPPNKIPGGLSEKKDLKDFDPKAIAKGQKVEMEHTTDAEIAREIARDHLTEDPAYYEKLERMEAGKCEGDKQKKARLTLAERAEFTRALHADATALIRAFKPKAAAFGITQKIKDEIDLLLRQYKGKPVPDSKVHAIAEGAGVPVDEVESYVYAIASKHVTEHEPATERVARLYLRQAAGSR